MRQQENIQNDLVCMEILREIRRNIMQNTLNPYNI